MKCMTMASYNAYMYEMHDYALSVVQHPLLVDATTYCLGVVTLSVTTFDALLEMFLIT